MKVGVIGAGTMGQGIAKAFAQTEGYEVALCDIKQEWAQGGKDKIVTKAKIDATMSKARLTTLCQIGISSGVTCTKGACQMADCLTVPNTKSCMAGMIFTLVWSATESKMLMACVSERSMAMMTSSTAFSFTMFLMS